MKPISTVREAKDFLAEKIVEQAKREGPPLTVIERKMLYFSETDWTLPEMAEVSAAFDREYDRDIYEQKIARLVHNIISAHSLNQAEIESWDEAVMKLSEGDHYLLVLLNCAEDGFKSARSLLHGFLPAFDQNRPRQPHDRLKLWITALAGAFGALGIMLVWNWLYVHSNAGFRSVSDWLFDDRERRGLIVLLVVVALVFGLKLKRIVALFSNRK